MNPYKTKMKTISQLQSGEEFSKLNNLESLTANDIVSLSFLSELTDADIELLNEIWNHLTNK